LARAHEIEASGRAVVRDTRQSPTSARNNSYFSPEVPRPPHPAVIIQTTRCADFRCHTRSSLARARDAYALPLLIPPSPPPPLAGTYVGCLIVKPCKSPLAALTLTALAFSLERAKKRATANPTRVTDAAEIARAPAAHLRQARRHRRPAGDIRERGHSDENHGPSTGTRGGLRIHAYGHGRASFSLLAPRLNPTAGKIRRSDPRQRQRRGPQRRYPLIVRGRTVFYPVAPSFGNPAARERRAGRKRRSHAPARTPERGLLPRSMSADIPDSGS